MCPLGWRPLASRAETAEAEEAKPSSMALTRFDDLARDYEYWFTTKLGAFAARREKELLLGLIQPHSGQLVLEVGSGTGYFLREVAGSSARCVGLEPSQAMLSRATARRQPAIDYARGRGEALPFKDASFDVVLFMTSLEFVAEVDGALHEATRVARPDGRLVLGVLNARGAWARARRREGGLWREARFFDAAGLASLLSSFGAVRLAYGFHLPPSATGLPAALMPAADWLLRRCFPASGALIFLEVKLGRQQ